jgi:DNA-directed RNA polymerase subunit RPC12/RpoP
MDKIFVAVCPECGRQFPVDESIRDLDVFLECPYCRFKFRPTP